jgi:hypothetical protein
MRRSPDAVVCTVPPAVAPYQVEVSLSRSASPLDGPYGFSSCIFTYEEDDVLVLPVWAPV